MTTDELKERLRRFCIRVIAFAEKLPKSYAVRVATHQVIRSSTSSAANYRAACRSKSIRDFINKLKMVEEELDETDFWLSVIMESTKIDSPEIAGLKSEVNELLAIIVASLRTAKANEKARGKE